MADGPVGKSPVTAAFFATEVELDALLAAHGNSGSLTLIAMSAEADYICARRGLTYVTVEDLVDPTLIYNQTEASFDRLSTFCQRLDAGLPQEAAGRFSWFHYFRALKVIQDSLMMIAIQGSAMLDRLAPSKLLMPKPPATIWTDVQSTCDPLWSAFARVAEQRGLTPTFVEVPLPSRTIAPLPRPTLRRLIVAMHRRLAYGCCKLTARTTIAALHPHEVRADLAPLKARVLSFADLLDGMPAVTAPWTDYAAWVARLLEADGTFTFAGINLMPLARDALIATAETIAAWQVAASHHAQQRMAELSVRAVASTAPNAPADMAVFVAARAEGVPSVVYQHGGFDGYMVFPMKRYSCLQLPDFSLTWGEGVSQELNQTFGDHCICGRSLPRLLPWTAVQIRDLYRRRESVPPTSADEPVRVCYVLNSLLGYRRYLAHHTFPDIKYWRLQRDVVEALASRRDVALTIRPYPYQAAYCRNPLTDFIADSNLPVTVSTSGHLDDDLLKADVIVIDLPSTTLVQAVATKARLVVFTGAPFMKLTATARVLLERRACLADSFDDFVPSVMNCIDDLRSSPKQTVDELFLQAYALHQPHEPVSLGRCLEKIIY